MSPASAVDKDPQLTVSIQSLSPSRLGSNSTVTMTGTVTNHDNHAWTNVQAYLVIPTVPFTTRAQVEDAIDNGNAYTGARVVDAGTFDDMGDLAPKQSRQFTVKVPYAHLGISGAEGVYPVGVQILGTDTGGERSTDAIARATTFLPLVSSGHQQIPASVVWPFLMPNRRGYDGDYADPSSLIAAVSAGGHLRNLLDLAANTDGNASTALIDPALLVGVDDLANGRHVADDVDRQRRFQATRNGVAATRAQHLPAALPRRVQRCVQLAHALLGEVHGPHGGEVDGHPTPTFPQL